jgi:hypothetical protein
MVLYSFDWRLYASCVFQLETRLYVSIGDCMLIKEAISSTSSEIYNLFLIIIIILIRSCISFFWAEGALLVVPGLYEHANIIMQIHMS